jgi:hypothetical protein
MLFYCAALPLSSRALIYVAGIIRRHLAAIGSYWRKLKPANHDHGRCSAPFTMASAKIARQMRR